MQRREAKTDENKEGQEHIRRMFIDNLIEIKEEEKQEWNDRLGEGQQRTRCRNMDGGNTEKKIKNRDNRKTKNK